VSLSSSKINTNASNVVADTSFVNVAVNGSNVAAFSATGLILNIANSPTAIVNAGTNGAGNIGATGATFNTVFARATTAQYADLAEIYTSDQQYSAGTVVIFGGEAEVTQSRDSHDTRIAGVVSTQPAYLMNHDAVGVPVALQGRVPCRVLGPVNKGDRVVSSHIAGVAQALDPLQYQPGCIIGKALQAIDSADISIIEVVVGRV
jgi:type IV secretory pathway TrbL component